MRYLVGGLKIAFLFLAMGIVLSIVACAVTYLSSGESDKANINLMIELSVCLAVSTLFWLICRRIQETIVIKENQNKDPFLYYRDPSRVYKKMNGETE